MKADRGEYWIVLLQPQKKAIKVSFLKITNAIKNEISQRKQTFAKVSWKGAILSRRDRPFIFIT